MMLGKQVRNGARGLAIGGIALALTACGGGSNFLSNSPLDLFSSSSKATNADTSANAAAPNGADNTDIECPSMQIRAGASTLTIGSKPGEAEPTALDVRYQATIFRMARECKVSAGVMTMKVGIEGRVITGPAGVPGTLDVPLRIAVVQEGIRPKPILSKFAREQVTITSTTDRATFTHIDPEISFPLPQPLGLIDSYVVYVGFDPLGLKPEPKRPPARRKPAAKPKQS